MKDNYQYLLLGATVTAISIYIGYLITERSNNKLFNKIKDEIKKNKSEDTK